MRIPRDRCYKGRMDPVPQKSSQATPPLLDHLLTGSSRTFALTIPLLPEPTRCEVTVAYLLFRVADTLEDSARWSRARKLDELQGFADFLGTPTDDGAQALAQRWREDPPHPHEGYRELLDRLPDVIETLLGLREVARRPLIEHTQRTIAGMQNFVKREQDGALELTTLDELQAYCYAVAGIVGELLTELYIVGNDDLQAVAEQLRTDAARFGEALQLVNILKDCDDDAAEGRRYLPGDIPRDEIFERAHDDLRAAKRYVHTLSEGGATDGVLAFNALPILLAHATLVRVREQGPGSKIGRAAVLALLSRLHLARVRGTIPALLERIV